MKIHIKNSKKAFTLIELLVVIAVISLLTALILNSLASSRMKANDTKIAEDLRQFRTAVDLYYNDNQSFPPVTVTMNGQDSKIAFSKKINSNWSNKLSFFVKIAEAAVFHATPLCHNFDVIATKLVERKYLAGVPVHPYDNDTNGVCYKAVNANTTFAVYAPLTAQMNVGGGKVNKRTGFILGDVSPAGVTNLVATTQTIAPTETPYPTGSDGETATNVAISADAIYGITSGISTTNTSSVSFDNNNSNNASSSNSGPTTYTLTINRGTVYSSGYSIYLYYNVLGGTVFDSPTSFPAGTSVSIYTAIYDDMTGTYKQPNFVGCDSVSGLTNCNVTMNGDRTIDVSE